jgi:hypothetical protein
MSTSTNLTLTRLLTATGTTICMPGPFPKRAIVARRWPGSAVVGPHTRS